MLFLVMFFCSAEFPTAQAAEYTVQSGDSLWSLQKTTGHTVAELEILNPRHKDGVLQPGDQLQYLSADDVGLAKAWCAWWVEHTDASSAEEVDQLHAFYAAQLADLKKNNIAFRPADNSRIMFDEVLYYADRQSKYLTQAAR